MICPSVNTNKRKNDRHGFRIKKSTFKKNNTQRLGGDGLRPGTGRESGHGIRWCVQYHRGSGQGVYVSVLPPAQLTNTILYCDKWTETLVFYEKKLGLPVTYRSHWFVEFALSETARVSVADASRTTVKSGFGRGITLSLQMKNLDSVWNTIKEAGITPTAITDHPMDARVFYLFDPEGHRIEIWSPV